MRGDKQKGEKNSRRRWKIKEEEMEDEKKKWRETKSRRGGIRKEKNRRKICEVGDGMQKEQEKGRR